jgi:YVTN family beta-propeller protein
LDRFVEVAVEAARGHDPMGAQNLACREAQRRSLTDPAPTGTRGTVSVIDTRTGHVLHLIRTGIKPHGLAYFPQPGRYSIGHNGVYR